MGRSTRRFALLAKIETTYGVDSVPTGAANAMLVKDLTMKPLEAENVDRGLLRAFFGGNEQLLGVAWKEVSFGIELVGASAAGVAPAWGPLLRACAMAETLTASTRADYTPISTALESVSMYCNYDGVQHILLGARGECSIRYGVKGIPTLSFRFQGLDGSESAVALPSTTLSAFQVPQVVTKAFTPQFKLGGTVSPTGAPAITGGTAFPAEGIEVQLGNALNFKNLIGLQEMEIVDRDVSGNLTIDQTAAEEVTRAGLVRLNTLTSIALEHGSVAGKKSLLYLPFAQLLSPEYVDSNKSLLQKYAIRGVPSAGNDELRLVCSY